MIPTTSILQGWVRPSSPSLNNSFMIYLIRSSNCFNLMYLQKESMSNNYKGFLERTVNKNLDSRTNSKNHSRGDSDRDQGNSLQGQQHSIKEVQLRGLLNSFQSIRWSLTRKDKSYSNRWMGTLRKEIVKCFLAINTQGATLMTTSKWGDSCLTYKSQISTLKKWSANAKNLFIFSKNITKKTYKTNYSLNSR